MVNKFSLLFHLRTDGVADPESAKIYVRVTLNGNRVKLGSTNITIKKADWNSITRRSKRKDVTSKADNDLLDAIEAQLRSIYLVFESERKLLTPNELKKRFRPKPQFNDLASNLITLYLAESASMRAKGHVAVKTHDTREDKLNVFKRFLQEERKTDLTVPEIKGPVLERFKNHLLLRGNKLSYAQKCQQFVKTFVRWCFHNGYIDADPTASYPVKVDKTPILEHLSEAELKSLTITTFTPKMQETVDCYLFACYTGLAYVDIQQLTPESLRILDGREYVVGGRQKTKTNFFIPLASQAKRIIEKYGGIDRLPLKSNKEVNYMLKLAMEKIGVQRRIWFHTGRKTFANRMQNVFGVSDETTMAMLGHRSTRELKAYRSITKERVLKEVHDLDF